MNCPYILAKIHTPYTYLCVQIRPRKKTPDDIHIGNSKGGVKKSTWAPEINLIHSGIELDSEMYLPSLTEDNKYNINKSETKTMNARAIWKNGLTFTGTADTGFSLPLGADPSVGGDDDGFRPMELIAIGLAGCTAMDVISILRKKRQEITDFEVRVQADRASDYPRVFTVIQITYEITGHEVQESAVKRAIELSEEKYCPAHAMLRKAALINCTYKIFEAS